MTHEIVALERVGTRTVLTINKDDGDVVLYALNDGLLESYMGAWGLPAGVTLTILLGDALIDDYEPPMMGAPGASETLQELLIAASSVISWGIDRDEALAEITLAEDTGEMVKATWAASAQQVVDSMVEEVDKLSVIDRQQNALAGGYQRRQEELLAEEFVSTHKEQNTGTVGSGGAIPMEFVNGELRTKE